MRIKVENSYHNTIEIVEAKSLEEAKRNFFSGLEVTAENLATNEIDEDWSSYYDSYEEAFTATYNDIYEQLTSELTFYVED